MTLSNHRKPSVLVGCLCTLLLAACAAPGSGPPATEAEIKSMLSGSSFNTGGRASMQSYYAPDGKRKMVGKTPEGYPIACLGTWRVAGSGYADALTCKIAEPSGIATEEYAHSLQVTRHNAMGGGLDYQLNTGESVGSWDVARKIDGFPKEAEFNALSKQLGL